MPIPYSLAVRSCEPGKSDSPKRVYPAVQSKNMTVEQFCDHLDTHMEMPKGDSLKFIAAVEDCLKEQILDGKAVELGFLGKYCVGVKSRGADRAENLSSASFRPFLRVQHYGENKWLQGASFELTTSRKSQVNERKAMCAAANAQLGVQSDPGTTPGTNPGGSLED